MLMASAGLGFYGLSVYLSTLNRVRGFSVAGMSGAIAVFFIVSGFAGVYIAKLLRTIEPRFIVVAGAIIAALSLVVLGRVTQLWHVYIVYISFGIGYAATALVVSTTLVARWFDSKRAIALSVASTGLSVGGIVLTPVAASWLRHQPLPDATLRIGILYALVVIPLSIVLLRPDPTVYGFGPDGTMLTAAERETGTAPIRSGIPYEKAIKSLAFRMITLTFFLALCSQVGSIAQLVKLSNERITNDATASRVVSVLAACSVTGRLLGGFLLAKISNRRFTMIVLWSQAVAIAALAFAHGTVAVFGAAMCFGLAIGNILLLHPLLLAGSFGVADYPRIYGRSQFVTTFGIAFGPFLYGWLHDHAGGYRTSYLVGAALSVIGALTYGFLGDRNQLLR
jgi:MFS family permease